MHLWLLTRLTHFSMTSTTSLPFRVGWSILPSALLIHSFMGTSKWKPSTKMPPLCEPRRAIRTHVARCCSSKLHLQLYDPHAARVLLPCLLCCAGLCYMCLLMQLLMQCVLLGTSKPVNDNLLASKQSLRALKFTSLSVTHDVLQITSDLLALTFHH